MKYRTQTSGMIYLFKSVGTQKQKRHGEEVGGGGGQMV